MLKCKIDGIIIIKPGNLEHQDELPHLPWPDKSPDLNIIKPPWAVFEEMQIPPTSLK